MKSKRIIIEKQCDKTPDNKKSEWQHIAVSQLILMTREQALRDRSEAIQK